MGAEEARRADEQTCEYTNRLSLNVIVTPTTMVAIDTSSTRLRPNRAAPAPVRDDAHVPARYATNTRLTRLCGRWNGAPIRRKPRKLYSATNPPMRRKA